MFERHCTRTGCTRPIRSVGLCSIHYSRKQRGVPMDAPINPRFKRGHAPKVCQVDECSRASVSRGMCTVHYRRSREGMSLSAPIRGTEGGLINWLVKQSKESVDECIEWPFAVNPGGYGVLKYGGRQTTASRAMCEMAHGEPTSDDAQAAHSCGNRICVNPKHVRWATPVENAADRLEHGSDCRGEKNVTAKLTCQQVMEIRRLKGVKSRKELSDQFGVSVTQVGSILNGRSWQHLPAKGAA